MEANQRGVAAQDVVKSGPWEGGQGAPPRNLALYEVPEAAGANRIREGLCHHAPKRVDWLDIAEVVLSLPIDLGSAERYGMMSHSELECGR